MASSYNTGAEPGLFLPTTELFDVGDLEQAGVNNELFKELLIRISQASNTSNLALNLKDTGYYVIEEFVNGQVFFKNPALSSTTAQVPSFRQVFRKVINFGTLPNSGAANVAHGITIDDNTTFTRIYGTASDVGVSKEYITLPYIDVSGTVAAGNIELRVDNTNVTITTTGDGTNFTFCYIILEYLKN